MSDRRKDSKGRVLRTGESQRKNGMYHYPYKDIDGTRRTIYDRNLQELRNKEKKIGKELEAGVRYFDGMVELSEVIDRLFSLKQKWRDSTRWIMTRYNELNDSKIDRCTHSVLHHTFSTKCIVAYMDVKTVQYLMDHSDVSTTLNIYTDNVFENVVSGMELLESSCN